ncbi:zinc ABC transporter substrate-binding protein [Aestuariibius insulae]|uniref:zinc ABC transporter substrate-binding protein n=1 Tax=Aestuariibius insulae TaxID=2058287 RepID=UPI00345EB6F9
MNRLGLILCAFAGNAAADTPRIVTDIAPVQSLVAMVTNGVTTPELLLEGSQDVHHAALTPAQANALQDADLVFWIGPDLTPWLSDALTNVASNATVRSLGGREGDLVLESRTHHGDHDHSHEGVDPHGWLDPANAISWLNTITEELSSLDPENAEIYQTNLERAKSRITEVDAEVQVMIGASDLKIMVGHDNLQYFENAYGLSFAGGLSDSEDIAPTSDEIRELREAAARDDVACLLVDQETSMAMVETVTEGTDLKIVTVDPIGRTLTPGLDLYADLLVSVGESVAACME